MCVIWDWREMVSKTEMRERRSASKELNKLRNVTLLVSFLNAAIQKQGRYAVFVCTGQHLI